MADEQFRTKHPGVPREWQLIGEGGNACVWSNGTHAIKRLKEGASPEAVARFRREAEILLRLKQQPNLRVVPVLEVRERELALEIVMDQLDGNLESRVEVFAGDLERAAAALEPVARTLAVMVEQSSPIYHRDLKPTNLLFRGSPDHLYVADFGCAFLAEDERLTPAKRAMGAWAYRPPEYSVGRIVEVTDKGDVFSLGKIFWSMINGEPGIVFPGPVWFEPEYDLSRIFPCHPRVDHAMIAIANATSINTAQRSSMQQFAEALRMLSLPARSSSENFETATLLRAQQRIEIEYAQRQAATAAFVRALHRDLHETMAELASSAKEVLLWSEWHREALGTPQTADQLVQQVAVQESDAPVVNSRFRRVYLTTRFEPPSEDRALVFWVRIGSEVSGAASHLEVTSDQYGVFFRMTIGGTFASSEGYNPSILREFLIKATRFVLKVDDR